MKKKETGYKSQEPEELFDRAKAEPIDPPRIHRPTKRTVAFVQDGHYYTATGVPIAPAKEADLEKAEEPLGKRKYAGMEPEEARKSTAEKLEKKKLKS